MNTIHEATRNINNRTWVSKDILLLLVVGLVITAPCLLYGFPFYGDDSLSNAILYREFAGQFWSGELYPRWLQKLNGGLGNPTGFYYPPLSYWLTGLVKPFFRADTNIWRQLGISVVFATVASGLAIYYWLVRLVDTRPALIASLTYMVLPYHINIDLYTRGALAELWSFVWMPLVLRAVDAVNDKRRLAVVGLACAYALLILTHLPTALIFSIVPLTYSLYTAPTKYRVKAPLLTMLGMSLGAGVSAIYLLPAVLMQDFIFHTTIGGHYYFGNWFLFSGLTWSGKYSQYFLASLGTMALVVASVAVGSVDATPVQKKTRMFWFAVACGCLLMMTPLSKPVWIAFPILQKIQFPFRFNSVLSLAAAASVAFSINNRLRKAQIIFLTLMSVFVVIWIYSGIRQAYHAYPANYVDQRVIDGATKREELRRDTNEFRPRWVPSIEEQELDALLERIGKSQGDLKKVNISQGRGSVAIERWSPSEIVLRVDTAAPGATLSISRFYFPGWSVVVDDEQVARAVEPSIPGGLISVKAPAGNHRLTVQLRKRLPEVAGQIVSVLSLLVLMMWVILTTQKREVRTGSGNDRVPSG